MLGPSTAEQLARALADLRMGIPVVLMSQTGAGIIASAEAVSASRFTELRTSFGDPVLVLTHRRAETIKIYAYDGSYARISVPKDRDLTWVKNVADPAADVSSGLKGPFQTLMTPALGVEHTALVMMKQAQILPAALCVATPNPHDVAAQHGLCILNVADIEPLLAAPLALRDVVAARLPTRAANVGRLHVFRPKTGADEHYAMEIGRPSRSDTVLVRLHSACFTGDVMGSLKCDCGPQLNAAMTHMGADGAGVLLYLNQEGRGIGLVNKMRAYSLQEQGFDTVEANHRLGFEDDERDFRIGASILREMGIRKIRLLTNNPRKIEMMERNGITVVERVPLQVGKTQENTGYLATKARKSGHLL
jgi:GTP cyclohydrolase II